MHSVNKTSLLKKADESSPFIWPFWELKIITRWHGNVARFPGPLQGREPIGHWLISPQKGQMRTIDVSLLSGWTNCWAHSRVVNKLRLSHDDVIKWKHFPCCWYFVRGIHRSPVNSPHKGQWRGTLMFSLIYAWINRWVNSREAGDLRRHRVRLLWRHRNGM